VTSKKLLTEGIRIRLCKGAYKESAEIAFAAKSEVDANYVKLMKILMKSGIYHGLATHDESIVQQAEAFATGEKLSRDSFEFQMPLRHPPRPATAFWCARAARPPFTFPSAPSGYPYFMSGWGAAGQTSLFIARNLLRA